MIVIMVAFGAIGWQYRNAQKIFTLVDDEYEVELANAVQSLRSYDAQQTGMKYVILTNMENGLENMRKGRPSQLSTNLAYYRLIASSTGSVIAAACLTIGSGKGSFPPARPAFDLQPLSSGENNRWT